MTRTSKMIVVVGLGLALARQGWADERIELGGFGGAHIFSHDNELGQVDSDTADSAENAFAFGVRVGYLFTELLSAEGELALMPTSARDSGTDVFVIGWRAQALFHFMDRSSKWRPFVVAGGGALTASSSDTAVFDNDTDGALHAGAGLKWRAGKSWGLRGDLRVLFPPSSDSEFATGDFELFLGVYSTFPRAPAPKPDPDTDGDGILDSVDACDDQPEDVDQFEDTDGCPDPDNDKDGILDAADQCPNEPESRNGVDDTDGCPEADPDGDGLVGSQDACPNEAEDKDGFEDTDGCPDVDNDKDGIPDGTDKCPAEPETKNGFEDEDGCADVVPVQVQQFTGTIEGIKFKKKSAEILKSSNAVLDAAAKVLTDYPTIRLEIQGHTSTEGSDEFNMTLSQQRADAVRAYLVSKGIDPARLEAKGYGETQLVADDSTEEGKSKNRRVEFVLIPAAP